MPPFSQHGMEGGEKMRRVIRNTYAGAVCEREVYGISELTRNVKAAKPPKPRFQTEEEREQHRLGISRRRHARLVNANFSPTSLYSTLTFSNEYEVHTFDEAKRVRENFIRRLKRACPEARIMAYLGRGKATNRIHLHMLSEGVPEELIRRQWYLGSVVRIEHLKEHNYYGGVDHGQDYTGLANYLFDHWTPEQGGHRWKPTKNLRQPEREKPKEIKHQYSEQKPPRAPKGYVLVESKATGYGYLYFKYVKIPPKRTRKKTEHEKMRS